MNFMARRKSNQIQPAPMTLFVPAISTNVPATGVKTSFYCDLSQMASIVNRRFYRQGINWAVAGIKIQTGIGSGTIEVLKIPNTWVASNAWEKAFRAWNKQQMDAIEEAGAESAVAKFRDFKIFADVEHVSAGFAANLLPYGGEPNVLSAFAPGEWQESVIVVPNVTADASGSLVEPIEYRLHMAGVNNNAGLSRGIIEGYAQSRAYPQSPDPVSPIIGSGNNWLRDMFDVGNDNSEITENATDRNDDLPYPQVEYPGGATQGPCLQLHDSAYWSNTAQTINLTHRIKGGNFPCGLVKINATNTSDSAGGLHIQIDLVPGNHRGYLCEPMTEM